MKKLLTASTLLLVFFLFVLFPEPVKAGAQKGLSLWYNSVVPILFPFIILSNLMISTESLNLFLRPFFLLTKALPWLNPWIFYPVFFGLFCGFPMGAKTIADLMEQGRLSKGEASLLLPIVNQASPMFLAGYLGIHILKKSLSFARILFYLYLPPAVFFGFLIFSEAFLSRSSSKRRSFSSANASAILHQQHSFFQRSLLPGSRDRTHSSTIQKNSMSPVSEHTIWNSFTVIVTIGIYMMLFCIASELCTLLLPPQRILSLFLCCLEFSSGLDRLSQFSFLESGRKTAFLLALTSFGGLCTAAQTYDIIRHTGLSMKSYLIKKALLACAVFLLYSSSISS